MVKTARREVQPVEIVRGVSDEVVMRVLDEACLHRVFRERTRSRQLVERSRPIMTFEWVNSTSILAKLPSSKLMVYPPSRRGMFVLSSEDMQWLSDGLQGMGKYRS